MPGEHSYRILKSLYSADGKRCAEICEFSDGTGCLLESEWIEGAFVNRHDGKMVGPFESPKHAERFIIATSWFDGRPNPKRTAEWVRLLAMLSIGAGALIVAYLAR